jgi:hypothetical protein
LVNQLFEISKSESVTLAEVPHYIKRKIEEKKRLETEIEKAGAILHDQNVDFQTIEEYKKFEDELKKHRLSMEDPRRLVSILHSINEIGRDPKKIISELARLKSLRKAERRLKNNCIIWESRAARYKEIVPMCKQFVSGGVGISLVMALESAAIKRTVEDGVPAGAAPFRIMQDIDDYNRLGGMKKQLHDILMQINITREFLGRLNNAINAFMKLRFNGWTEDQILKACRVIEANGHPYYPQSNNSHSGYELNDSRV